MALHIECIASSEVPVEVEGVTPDVMQPMNLDQIKRLKIFQGNREMELADLFNVQGDPIDGEVHWNGDLTGVHWIGAKMSAGKVTVHGSAGRHVGSEMSGGRIDVMGDTGDWVGGEMHGGTIHVRGRAGHLIGAAYRGSRRGMTGGSILINGNVGNEVGHTMRRGLLAVGGDAGDLVGFNMLAGTILIMGNAGIRHGAGMKRGTIGLWGKEPPALLPTFRYACQFSPPMLPMLLKYLHQHEFDIPEALRTSEYQLFHGDQIEGGRGEILVPVKGR